MNELTMVFVVGGRSCLAASIVLRDLFFFWLDYMTQIFNGVVARKTVIQLDSWVGVEEQK